MSEPGSRVTTVLVIVGLIAILGWNFRHVFMPEPEPVPVLDEMPPEVADVEDAGPQHLIEPEPIHDRESGELVSLPTLDDSDSWFLLAIDELFGRDTSLVFVREALIDRLVATIDSLPRSHTPETIRPVTSLVEPFRVDMDGDTILLGPENFARYDELVARITAANPDDIVLTYRRFYPLFQESYQRLGYPNDYFNDRVVEVIDHLLATPEPDRPLVLTRPKVLFKFADIELEALSSGQKLMLRIGNDHAMQVKQVLTQLRASIVQSP